jgi:hypothetical protein
MKTPSQDSQKMLDTLKVAVKQALERKKRLGQYAVVWGDNKPIIIGDDAPQETGSVPRQ